MKNEVDRCREFCSQIDTRWSVFADIDDTTSDSAFNPFPLLEEFSNFDELYTNAILIDEGGMKQIFSVHDVKSNRIVAMARLKEGADEELCEKFLREARITASLQHPNILSVYDIGVDSNKMPFFTMELLQGEQLGKVIEQNYKGENSPAFTTIKWLTIFSSICDAVNYTHSRGILHLDLKPDNIFIGEYGEVYVYDWGLAKLVDAVDSGKDEEILDRNILNDVTNTGYIKGTPGYMAPEQITGKSKKDVRTDIYSLGALLYTMLSGVRPIAGATAIEQIENTVIGVITPPSIRSKAHPISPGLEAVIMKALQRGQEDRYQSIEELNVDIRNYLNGYATIAEQAGVFTRILLLISRHKNIFIALFVSTIFAVVVLVTAYLRVNTERNFALEQQRRALKEKQTAEKNLSLYLETEKVKRSMELSLSHIMNKQIGGEDLSHAGIQLQLLEQHIEMVDESKKDLLYEKKGILHFLIEEFAEAEESFKRVEKKSKILTILLEAAQMGKELIGDKKALSDDDLARVFATMRPLYHNLIRIMFLTHINVTKSKSRSLDDFGRLAMFMIYLENNLWGEAVVVATADSPSNIDNGRLNFSNSRIRALRLDGGFGNAIFSPVRFSELDLSYSDFKHFKQLVGMNVDTVNIVGCRVGPDLNSYWLARIKEEGPFNLILDPKSFTDKDLTLLKRYLTVIDGTK